MTNKWNGLFLLIAFFIGFFSSISSSFAQSYKGSINLKIVARQGDAMPDVAATIEGDIYKRTLTSNRHGRIHIGALLPGSYKVTVSSNGYKTVVFSKVQVDTSSSVKLNVVMEASRNDTGTQDLNYALLDPQRTGTRTVVSDTELSSLPYAGDPWAILNTIPGIQSDRINIGGSESGEQASFVSKGDNGSNTSWMIDGVEFTNMVMEGASEIFFDQGSLYQIGFTTGGSDVSSGSSGTTIHLITKNGSNEHQGSMRLLFTNDGLQSENLPDGISSRRINEIFERGIEIGGPIVKDRLWYWGAFSQNTIENAAISGIESETQLENKSFKIQGRITDTTRASGFYTESDRQIESLFNSNSRPPETQWVQKSSTPIYKLEVNQLIGQNTELSFIYGRVDGGSSLSPRVSPDTAQPVFNQQLGRWEKSYRELDFSRPSRQYEIKGNTYLTVGNSDHEFDYGFQYKNAWSIERESWGANGTNLWVSDYSGVGSTSYFFAHRDRFAATELDTTSMWVKDTMTFGNLTIKAGLRYNNSDSSNTPSTSVKPNPLFPEAVPSLTYEGEDPQFEYDTLAYQLGGAYTFGEDHQYLVHGNYRQYFDNIGLTEARTINPAGRSWITGFAQDFDGDGQYDASELGFALDENGDVIPYSGNEATQNPYRFRPTGLNPNSPGSVSTLNTIDPNLSPPEVEEIIIGGEWSITPDFSIAAAYTVRERSNTQWALGQLGDNRLISSTDFELAHTLLGTNPETGQQYSVDYYVISAEANELQRRFGGTQLTNRPDYSEDFEGFELTATKRLSNKWMLRGHLAFSDWTRNVGPGGLINPTPDATRSNVDGSDVAIASPGAGSKNDVFPGTASWTASMSGLYQLPWGLELSGVLTAREGYQAPIFNSANGFRNGAGRAANTDYSIGPTDSLRYDDLVNLNLRISKNFSLGPTEIILAGEIFNVFNEDTVLQLNRSYGIHRNDGSETQDFSTTGTVRSTYRRVDEYLAPRIVRFSATINF